MVIVDLKNGDYSRDGDAAFRTTTVNLPRKWIELMDQIAHDIGVSRSELMRQAIRDFLLSDIKIKEKVEAIANGKYSVTFDGKDHEIIGEA